MSDKFSNFYSSLDSPASSAFSITPDDNNDLSITTRMIYVGVSGDISVELSGDPSGSSVLLKSVPVGILSLRIRKVLSTGTTATNLVGLY